MKRVAEPFEDLTTGIMYRTGQILEDGDPVIKGREHLFTDGDPRLEAIGELKGALVDEPGTEADRIQDVDVPLPKEAGGPADEVYEAETEAARDHNPDGDLPAEAGGPKDEEYAEVTERSRDFDVAREDLPKEAGGPGDVEDDDELRVEQTTAAPGERRNSTRGTRKPKG